MIKLGKRKKYYIIWGYIIKELMCLECPSTKGVDNTGRPKGPHNGY